MKFELDRAEISQAIADYIAKKTGRSSKFDVTISATMKVDAESKPIGDLNITATVKESD